MLLDTKHDVFTIYTSCFLSDIKLEIQCLDCSREMTQSFTNARKSDNVYHRGEDMFYGFFILRTGCMEDIPS